MELVNHTQTIVTRQVMLTEREAMFVRDLFGGMTSSKIFEHILSSHNLGKWSEKEAVEQFYSLYRDLDNAFRGKLS